ncbi:caspase family protein [Streptomyces naphthomycinicus]|uniref:wHTH domain-containing protein n=1 Tax=Streptomyces naphthomycinicus TaxID=2872625 RepID=UPI001CEDFABE|nr:caspase family protein [Streptomyces sp. TML10]
MSAGRRRALLIGVPAYPQLAQVPELSGDFPGLAFAANDVATLRATLLRSGYAAEHVRVLDDEDATGEHNIRDELGRFLNSCEDGDVGLVYFSGHGVRFGETDYLLPSDVRARWGADGERTLGPKGLIEIAPDELLAPLRSSATVMLCFDACRSSGDTPPATFEAMKVSRPWDNVVLVSACAPGEEALGHADAGSVLAMALNETLAPESSARTFGQVIQRVELRAEEIAASYTYSRPPRALPRWLSIDGTGGRHADVPLCDATASSGPWTDAVIRSSLWEYTEGTPAQRGKAREHLAEVVKKTVAIRRQRDPEADPWDDERVPPRLIERLGHLVEAAGARLSLVEAVVLLGAPFLREAALSCGLAALRTVDGDGTAEGADDRELPEDSFAAHLERDMGDVRRAHRQIEATRRTLLRRGEKDDARSAEYWLRHRFLADWDLLWEQRGDAELDSLRAAVDLLVRAAESAAGLTLGTHERGVLRHAVVKVVSQLGTGTPADTGAPDGTPWDTEAGLCAYLCGEADRWSWRPREMATLLHLAGRLAIDPRMLDGVIIDHLGPREPMQVRPEQIKAEIARNDGFLPVTSHWPAEAGGPGRAPGTYWRLVFKCGSAALFTALDRLASGIAAESGATRRVQSTLRSGDLLFGLPQLVKTEGLIPINHGFDKPPPRFRLAEDEVKPLIMGTQLYGDRMLAVRELYQNALDACRVRQARRRYADLAGRPDGQTEREQLAGCSIVFTQDIDPVTRRMYIQCEDNGVGMSAEELRDLFAQAGRRSEQSSARMREMRRWRRRGVTTELNSRFGIGVFSYFMLAEEIEVTTRPVDGHGQRPLDGHRANVTAGSGLMHLGREPLDLAGGGTRVRLYLHDDPDKTDEQRPSLIQALREFLWCTPVEVTATELGGDPAVWQPGDLYGDSSLRGERIEATEDVWWVQGPGMLLSDGLLVSDAKPPYGYVVNLRRRHRPELSVDRNRFLGYDERGVEQDLKEAVPALVRKAWRPFPLDWLWNLTESWPRLALEVIGQMMEHDVPVEVPDELQTDDWGRERQALSLRELGCLPVDDAVLKENLGGSPVDMRFFKAWRAGALGVRRPQEMIGTHAGLPVPEPLDAVLFRDAPDKSLMEPMRAAADTGRSLRDVTRRLRRYAVTGVPVPEVADVRALDGVVPGPLATALYEALYSRFSLKATMQDDAAQSAVRRTLVHLSAAEKVRLAGLAELLEQLSGLDPVIPRPPDLGSFASHRVDARERRILLNDQPNGKRSLHHTSAPFTGLVRPVDVAYRAQQTGIPPAEIEAVVRRFAPLGYRLAGPDLPYLLNDAQLEALSRDLDAQPPFFTPEPIGLPHLVRLAARRGETVGDTAAWLAEWGGPLGVEVADPASLAWFRPPAWCEELPLEMLVPGTIGEGGDQGVVPLSTWDVLATIEDVKGRVLPHQHLVAVETLADAGLVETRAVEAVRVLLAEPRPGRFRSIWRHGFPVPGLRDGYTDPANVGEDDRVEPASLVAIAADLGQSLRSTAETMRSQMAAYGVEVPELPEEVAGLKPDRTVRNILCSAGFWRERIALDDLVGFAEATETDLPTAAARLNAYRSLGAPTVPVPPDFVPPAEPRERDLAAEHALLQEPLEQSWTLTPLALVVAAGRLGGGLRETYRRLEPFTLIGLEIRFPEPDCDRVPDWRDVVLLTARLTGREPVLAGDVSADHLRLAAEETESTVDDVRARLADYAPLFAFRLPPDERI